MTAAALAAERLDPHIQRSIKCHRLQVNARKLQQRYNCKQLFNAVGELRQENRDFINDIRGSIEYNTVEAIKTLLEHARSAEQAQRVRPGSNTLRCDQLKIDTEHLEQRIPDRLLFDIKDEIQHETLRLVVSIRNAIDYSTEEAVALLLKHATLAEQRQRSSILKPC